MKNIITVDLSFDTPGSVNVNHNGQLLSTLYKPGTYTFDVDANQMYNRFVIIPKTPLTVNYITMFDIGLEKLVYFGMCNNGINKFQSSEVAADHIWELEYQSPVFKWLHSVLDHGWLVGP
jgi:hypothetical protein